MTHVTDRSQLCKMASQCSQSALQCSKTPATPAAKKKYVDYHGREGVSAYLQREGNCQRAGQLCYRRRCKLLLLSLLFTFNVYPFAIGTDEKLLQIIAN